MRRPSLPSLVLALGVFASTAGSAADRPINEQFLDSGVVRFVALVPELAASIHAFELNCSKLTAGRYCTLTVNRFIPDACENKSTYSIALDTDIFRFESNSSGNDLSIERIKGDALLLRFPQFVHFTTVQAQLLVHLSFDSKYRLFGVASLEGTLNGVDSAGKLVNLSYSLSRKPMTCRVSIPE